MKKHTGIRRTSLTCLALALSGLASAQVPTPEECAVVDVDQVGWERLTAARSHAAVGWWVEAGDELLACGSPGVASALEAEGFRLVAVHPRVEADHLRLGRGLEPDAVRDLEARVLVRAGSSAVLLFEGSLPPPVVEAPPGERDFRALVDVPPHLVLARQVANAPPRPTRPLSAETRALADEVDAQRWFDDIVTLASHNRYTHGSGILAARDWVAQQLQALPGVTVTTPSFHVGSTTAYNVVGTLPGTTQLDDWYIVGGHYDSTSQAPYTAAPGAEDNASGCAGVLEMARIFALHPPSATMLFICYAGEEQGLYGSEDHAGDLVATGDAGKVRAMLDMDMIGYTGDAELDCLLETDAWAQDLLQPFEDAAAQVTTLVISTALGAFGSDHVPYLDRDMPALLTIENDWDSYPDYHRTTDLPANITLEMGRQVLRMNVAAVAEMAGVESGLLFRDSFESGDLSAWSAASP